MSFKLDTGAQAIAMFIGDVMANMVKPIDDVRLTAFGGSKFDVVGQTDIKLGDCYTKFLLINKPVTPILGLKSCIELNLIKQNNTDVLINMDSIVNKSQNVSAHDINLYNNDCDLCNSCNINVEN